MDDVLCKNLDAVLRRLASNKTANKGMKFATACKDGIGVINNRGVEELKQHLLGDGYIEGYGFGDGRAPYSITSSGIAFLRDGGYTQQYKNEVRDNKIKDKQLKGFKFPKWAVIISILFLLLAIASYIKQWNVF